MWLVNTTQALQGGALQYILMLMIALCVIGACKQCGAEGRASRMRPHGERTCRACHPEGLAYHRLHPGTQYEYDLFVKPVRIDAVIAEEDGREIKALQEVRDDLQEQLEDMECERDEYREEAEQAQYELEDMESERDDMEELRDEMEQERDDAISAADELAAQNTDLLNEQLDRLRSPTIDPHVITALFARMPSEWVANILTNVLIDAVPDTVQTTLDVGLEQ